MPNCPHAGVLARAKQVLMDPIGRIHRYFCRSPSEGLGAAVKAFLL
ncbi:hypothetical protein [Synechococcus sp. WH 7805]